MKKLTDYPEDTKFWKGTILSLKGIENTPQGKFDRHYCMIADSCSSELLMLDLSRSAGSIVLCTIECDIENCQAISKKAVIKWIKENFYAYVEVESFPDLAYIDNISNYFQSVNKDLFL